VHDADLIIVGTHRDAEMRRSQDRAAILPDILRDPLIVGGIIRVLAAEGRLGGAQPIAFASYKTWRSHNSWPPCLGPRFEYLYAKVGLTRRPA